MNEAIAYLVGWQRGSNPMGHAIRAAYIWQNGEYYTYAPGEPPLCWVLNPAKEDLKNLSSILPDISCANAAFDEQKVTITVIPPSGTTVWGLEQYLSSGLEPSSLAGPNATWDTETRKVSWWSTGDQPVMLEYSITPEIEGDITGAASFDGLDIALSEIAVTTVSQNPTDTHSQEGEVYQSAGTDDEPSADTDDVVPVESEDIRSEQADNSDSEEGSSDDAPNSIQEDARCGAFDCDGSKQNIRDIIEKGLSDWLIVGLGMISLAVISVGRTML